VVSFETIFLFQDLSVDTEKTSRIIIRISRKGTPSFILPISEISCYREAFPYFLFKGHGFNFLVLISNICNEIFPVYTKPKRKFPELLKLSCESLQNQESKSLL
ncbi:hypothetical protein, partial [Bacteroides heparinolyticus]|uniref:hypothetical protein n=1 Tax=Prevotella heparinolytica TaxID=28113 RepID=UPI0035A15DF0